MAGKRFNFSALPAELMDVLARAGGPVRRTVRGKQPDECLTLDEFVAEALKSELKLKDIRRDSDGDIPIWFGSSVIFVSSHEEDSPFLSVWSTLLHDVEVTPGLYEAVNAVNANLEFAKLFIDEENRNIVMEAWLIVMGLLNREQIAFAVEYLGDAADHFDTLLQQRFGGYLASEDVDDDDTVEF